MQACVLTLNMPVGGKLLFAITKSNTQFCEALTCVVGERVLMPFSYSCPSRPSNSHRRVNNVFDTFVPFFSLPLNVLSHGSKGVRGVRMATRNGLSQWRILVLPRPFLLLSHCPGSFCMIHDFKHE